MCLTLRVTITSSQSEENLGLWSGREKDWSGDVEVPPGRMVKMCHVFLLCVQNLVAKHALDFVRAKGLYCDPQMSQVNHPSPSSLRCRLETSSMKYSLTNTVYKFDMGKHKLSNHSKAKLHI